MKKAKMNKYLNYISIFLLCVGFILVIVGVTMGGINHIDFDCFKQFSFS